MEQDIIDLVKKRLSEISDYSLAQFFALVLTEMHRRGGHFKDPSTKALWDRLKGGDPNHGD